MASFKNSSLTITSPNTEQLLYQCGNNLKSAVIHAVYIANKGNEGFNVSVILNDSSANVDKFVAKNVIVFRNTTLVLDKVINLEPSDSLKISCSDTNCDVVASVLEME